MNTGNLISGIGRSNEAPSIPELIFREHQAGRISKREYFASTAAWVAENLDEYPCQPYPPLPPLLRDYVLGRSDDRRAREQALSFRLGQWLYSIQNIRIRNEANASSMAWCLEKLREVKLAKEAETVERHGRLFNLPMPEGFSAALMVQAKDSLDKQREERGRR